MPRPFRFRPPAPPVDVLARPRLQALLRQRWTRRVVSVVAGPGFGKTALLSTGIADIPAGATQVWLSCEPADEDGDHLVAGMARALELPDDASLGGVLDAVWARSPDPVCLIFDDVHEVPEGTQGIEILGELTVELAGNAHLVFASRTAVPVPLARIAASGQLVRIGEDELLFDADELTELAARFDLPPDVLTSSGGWPALAALTVNVGSDLVIDYLWEEVLARIGDARAHLLACFHTVGGGDDQIATAVAQRPTRVEELTDGVPLVERAPDGSAALHPLWGPALRRLLTPEQATDVRRRAAEEHLAHQRHDAAVDLFVEAEAYDRVRRVILDTVTGPTPPATFGRWYRRLPPATRDEPEALLAHAIDVAARAPAEAPDVCARAAAEFRARGETEGEVLALSAAGLMHWWANDPAGLLPVYLRLVELAEQGSEEARVVAAIGDAAIAHLAGDSTTVLAALDGLDDRLDERWRPTVLWLRAVAHRRSGDLAAARAVLGQSDLILPGDPQAEIARIRTDWLAGDVDGAIEPLATHLRTYTAEDVQYLARESAYELAAKAAVLGRLDVARDALGRAAAISGASNPLLTVLDTIARAAIAVGEDDEAAAATLLAREQLDGTAALGRPEAWYWRDRAAIALGHVLVPATRPLWDAEPLGPCHRVGIDLAHALESARAGEVADVRALDWPPPGVVRAHLPPRWIAELAEAGAAAGNPPPDELLSAVGELARPAHHLAIEVLGPLQLRRDEAVVSHPALRRRRVRELLLYLVIHGPARREVVEDAFWADAKDPAHNLRVTLNYLQQLLEPDRERGSPSYFLEVHGGSLALRRSDRLHVDAWQLADALDAAESADRANDVSTAIEHYRAVLPLWRGEPFADAPYAEWAEAARYRVRTRYIAAATRVGELWLAGGDLDAAVDAARHALTADAAAEPACRLLARALMARGDRPGAMEALRLGVGALEDLGVEPDRSTSSLLAEIAAG